MASVAGQKGRELYSWRAREIVGLWRMFRSESESVSVSIEETDMLESARRRFWPRVVVEGPGCSDAMFEGCVGVLRALARCQRVKGFDADVLDLPWGGPRG